MSSSRTVRSVQGQMWDQIAVAKLTREQDMLDIASINAEYADVLELAGELTIVVPEKPTVAPARTLPPWER